jgi:hypothetical protein
VKRGAVYASGFFLRAIEKNRNGNASKENAIDYRSKAIPDKETENHIE